MQDLISAVQEVENWSADKKGDRENVAKCLNETAEILKEAINIWQDVISNPAKADEGEMSTMNMVGGERSRKLHAIGLDTIANKREIFKMVGGEVEYFSGLQDSLVEDAYPQLKTGQTLSDRANEAIETMQKTIGELEDLAKRAAA
jgi:anaerobic ribonucleoside-triphosphate reductase